MIEINLLPVEFRPRDKTNVPMMLTIAVGMLVAGSVVLWGMQLNGELGKLRERCDELTKQKVLLESDVKKVEALKGKIAQQKARQDTIIEISQSKVMWSLKLQQLATIMADFPQFWIKNLTVTKTKGGQALKLQLSATGNDLRRVARFRDALKLDPNFAYHFAELEGFQVQIIEAPNYTVKEIMEFPVLLPLVSNEKGN